MIRLLAAAALMSGLVLPQPSCSWSTVPGSPIANYDIIDGLKVLDDGTGPALYILGGLYSVGAPVIKYDGTTFTPMPWTFGAPIAPSDITVYDDGSGPSLYISANTGATAGSTVLQWDGTTWVVPFGGPPFANLRGALAVYDWGLGPALIHASTHNGTIQAYRAGSWTSIGTMTSPICAPSARSLEVWDNGAGAALYVGGRFSAIDGVAAESVARWTGPGTWTALGGGIPTNGWCPGAHVEDLEVFDDGTGARLYATADRSTTRAEIWQYAAATGWNPLIPRLQPAGCAPPLPWGYGFAPSVADLEVFDPGTGPRLYASGRFSLGLPVSDQVGAWDGTNWSTLGGGVTMGLCWSIESMAVFDDGTGPALYAGGSTPFTLPNGATTVLGRFGCGSGISLTINQAAPGAPVWLANANLTPGRTYRNVFSFPCAGPAGSGPFYGLCFGNGSLLATQSALPVGIPPFHWTATDTDENFGPYNLPPFVVDTLCADVTGGVVGTLGPVVRVKIR